MLTKKVLNRSINSNKRLFYISYLDYKKSGFSLYASYCNAVYIANGGFYLWKGLNYYGKDKN